MFCDCFNCVNLGHVKFNVFGFPNRICTGLWDHPEFRVRVACMSFNLIPNAKFGFGGPNVYHIRAGITFDHWIKAFWIGEQLPAS